MAVPKKKTSHRRTRQRRAHDSLNAPNLVACKKCGEMGMPHRACTTCGYYGDKKVLDVESGLAKKLKKQDNKEDDKS